MDLLVLVVGGPNKTETQVIDILAIIHPGEADRGSELMMNWRPNSLIFVSWQCPNNLGGPQNAGHIRICLGCFCEDSTYPADIALMNRFPKTNTSCIAS
jgi:hypothetical protein